MFFTRFNLSPLRFKSKKTALAAVFALLALLAPQDARASAASDAIKAAAHGDWARAERTIAALHDPAASKLFYWMAFTQGPEQNWTENQFARLSQFIRQNPDWPALGKLVSIAEKAMPDDLPPAAVIAWYADYPPDTAKGMDQYMQALLNSGREQEARAHIARWWAEKPLGREEQQSIFRKYFSYLDRSAHEKRVDNLLFAKQFTNARAIAAILGNGWPELVEARIALAEDKPGIETLIAKTPARLQNDPGLLFERLSWRRRHDLDIEAIQILHRQPPMEKISNPESWWKERHIMIRRLLERKDYVSAYMLAKEHEQEDGAAFADAEWMKGWLALRFLRQPAQAFMSFQKLYEKVETPISKARAAYWAGRAAEAVGQDAIATQWYQVAARNQTVYYGQLAAARISAGEALPAVPPPILTDEDRAAFASRDLVRAARLLHAAGLRDQTSQFIRAFAKADKTPKGYMYAAQMAADMGQYHDAVRIAKDATTQGLFLTAQSYPLMVERMRGVDIEWALVHSIIRQESMFDPEAQSPAGALGLMQVMPATGSEVARKLGVAHNTAMLISSPTHNILIGSAYLERLLERFAGSYVMTIAAYNAGPNRVDQWIDEFGDPRLGQIDLIDWIEMIPISETRNYVQRVLENVYVYRLRLKGKQPDPTHDIHIAMP